MVQSGVSSSHFLHPTLLSFPIIHYSIQFLYILLLLTIYQSDCKDTTSSEVIERFCYFPSLSVAIWYFLSLSVTFRYFLSLFVYNSLRDIYINTTLPHAFISHTGYINIDLIDHLWQQRLSFRSVTNDVGGGVGGGAGAEEMGEVVEN